MVNDGRRWKRTSLSISCPGVICYRQRVHKEPKIEWGLLEKKKHPASWKNERQIGVHIGWTHPFLVFFLALGPSTELVAFV